jgi:hypothetical protein
MKSPSVCGISRCGRNDAGFCIQRTYFGAHLVSHPQTILKREQTGSTKGWTGASWPQGATMATSDRAVNNTTPDREKCDEERANAKLVVGRKWEADEMNGGSRYYAREDGITPRRRYRLAPTNPPPGAAPYGFFLTAYDGETPPMVGSAANQGRRDSGSSQGEADRERSVSRIKKRMLSECQRENCQQDEYWWVPRRFSLLAHLCRLCTALTSVDQC